MSAISGFREGLHTWLLGGYRRYLQARRILNRCKNPLRVLVYGFLLVYVVWFLLSLYYTRTHVYHIQHEGREFELTIEMEYYNAFRLNPGYGYLMQKQFINFDLREKNHNVIYGFYEYDGSGVFGIEHPVNICKFFYVSSYRVVHRDEEKNITIMIYGDKFRIYQFQNERKSHRAIAVLPIDHPAFATIKVDEDYNEWKKTSTYPKNKYWRPSTTFLNFYNPTPKVHPVGSRYPKQTFLRLLKKLDEGKALFEDDFYQFDALANQLIEEDFRSIGGLNPMEKTESKK